MADIAAAKRRVAACYETLIENPSLRYSGLVKDVLEDVDRLAADRGFRETNPARFRQIQMEHEARLTKAPPTTAAGQNRSFVEGVYGRIPALVRNAIPAPLKKIVRAALR